MIGPPTSAVPVSTFVSGLVASVCTPVKKNGNALNGFRRNR
jgi:hypothetical protein